MKLINKKDVKFKSGYLVDKAGNIYNTRDLVAAVATYNAMLQINDYVRENIIQLQHLGQEHEVEIDNRQPQAIKISKPKTEVIDRKIEEAMAVIEETEKVQSVNEGNLMLRGGLHALTEFIANDEFVFTEEEACSKRLIIDPTLIGEGDLVEEVTYYCKSSELRDKIKIKHTSM